MGIIKTASFGDLGYTKLGPRDDADVARTEALRRVIEKYSGCQIQLSGRDVWFRDPARKRGVALPKAHDEVAHITRQNLGDDDEFRCFERYAATDYARKHAETVDAKLDGAVRLLGGFRDATAPRWKAAHDLAVAIQFCPAERLTDFMREHVLPAFFEAHPRGEVLVFMDNDAFQSRFAALRAGYTLSQYPLSELQASGVDRFGTLSEWQSAEVPLQTRTVSALGTLAFYPFVPYLHAGPLGLDIFFVFDDQPANTAVPFPSSWLALARSKSDFARQGGGAITPADLSNTDRRHARLVNSRRLAPAEIVAFVRWLMGRYDTYLFHATDPGEFEADGVADFVLAIEHSLTVDRVLRRSLSCLSSEETSWRKMAAMEVADLLESVQRDWTGRQDEWFKTLFNPTFGRQIVRRALGSVPAAAQGLLLDAVDKAYNDLLATVKASVWLKSKASATGVKVKSKDLAKEREESWDEFTANLMRVLRNTHHGYLTAGDRAARPSRYLALVTGDTPDSLSHLGVLWAIAMLAEPKEIIGWDWKPTGVWD